MLKKTMQIFVPRFLFDVPSLEVAADVFIILNTFDISYKKYMEKPKIFLTIYARSL